MLKLKEQGKIREIGVCNFNDIQLREACALAPLVSYQPQYSLLDRTIEKKEVAVCAEKNLAIIPRVSIKKSIESGMIGSLNHGIGLIMISRYLQCISRD